MRAVSNQGRQMMILPVAADTAQCRSNRPRAKPARAGSMENEMGEQNQGAWLHVMGERHLRDLCRKGGIGGCDVPSLPALYKLTE